jgi:Tol biopolymer transport system component
MTSRLMLAMVASFGAAPVAAVAQPATTRSVTVLLYKSGDEVFPAAWSRTDQLLLTVVTGGTPHMWLVTPAGQQIRELRGPTPNTWASDFDPTGQEALMEVYERGVSDLYRLVIETGRLARVTTTPWNEWHPSWSPDGRSLVFDTDSGGRTPRLTMLDLASGTRSPLTRGTRPEQGARWSPNGRRLAFHRHTGVAGDTNYDVFTVDRATRHETRITNDLADSGSPAWSPDGRKLAFSSNRNGAYEIYVACADGTGLSRLTTGGPDKKYPLWSPDGRRIVYQRRGEGIWTVDATAAPECGTSQR